MRPTLVVIGLMVATMTQVEGKDFFNNKERDQAVVGHEKSVTHDSKKNTNRLIDSNSPYLLQHAYQPVDWYPWSDGAFEKARDENKPVFLSIGYSTCHWCHVMAHESFDDPGIARILNKHFVAIKVDREERPDIDDYYMMATQLFTGRGGWPNSLWLTADKKPWFCGTYFPKDDRPGLTGFESLLAKLAEIWQSQNETILVQADQIHDAIASLQQRTVDQDGPQKSPDFFQELLRHYEKSFDPEQGGFSGAPKFPPHQQLENLFYSVSVADNETHKKMIKQTLDAMARGGIRDHIGGGFHRYATDHQWRVPHFEKMLYDNALFIRAYSKGYQLFKEPVYREIVEETIEWLTREMKSNDGGFYSALDADSEGEEGRYYIWEYNQLKDLFTDPMLQQFGDVYNIDVSGNYRDEISQKKNGHNILYQSNLETSEKMKMMKQRLLEKRNDRIRPHLDDKVITAWNGMLISSLVVASQTFDQPKWLQLAEETGKRLDKKIVKDGTVYRSYRQGRTGNSGFLNDYAFLSNSFLDLYFATEKEQWLKKAIKISIKLESKFGDPYGGGYFLVEKEISDLPFRSKDLYDNVLPSGNAVALHVMLQLQQLDSKNRVTPKLDRTVQWIEQQLVRTQVGLDSAALVMQQYKNKQKTSVKQGDEGSFPMGNVVFDLIPLNKKENTWSFEVRFNIQTDWHINSSKPLENYLVPFKVELENKKDGKLLEIRYPKGNEIKTSFENKKISVYNKRVTISGKLKVYHDRNIEEKPLFLKLFYQACNDQQCLAPKTLKIGSK